MTSARSKMGRELTELDGDLDENSDILPWKNKGIELKLMEVPNRLITSYNWEGPLCTRNKALQN